MLLRWFALRNAALDFGDPLSGLLRIGLAGVVWALALTETGPVGQDSSLATLSAVDETRSDRPEVSDPEPLGFAAGFDRGLLDDEEVRLDLGLAKRVKPPGPMS